MSRNPDPNTPYRAPDSINDIIGEKKFGGIIRNRSLLEPDEIVDEGRLVGRDSQLTEITRHFRGAINGERSPDLFLYGPSGTGKSLVINTVCENLLESCETRDCQFGVIHMNCRNVETLGSAVYKLAQKIATDAGVSVEVPKHGIKMKEKWRELYRLATNNYDTIVFILDDLDLLVGRRDIDEPAYSRLFYQLSQNGGSQNSKANVLVTSITNDSTFISEIKNHSQEGLNHKNVHFTGYDAEQLREILSHRTDAFYEKALSEDVIPLIAAFAAQSNGDARKAIDLMRTAGYRAEREMANQVTGAHVRKAQAKVDKNRVLKIIRGISTEKKLCLLATAAVARQTDNETAKSPNGYTVYQYLTDTLNVEQYYRETYVNKMKELTTYPLLKSERTSQGPHTGSYLEFSFAENPTTIVDALCEDSRFDDVHEAEIQAVVRAQLREDSE